MESGTDHTLHSCAVTRVLQMSSCSSCPPCHPRRRLSRALSPEQEALDPVEAQIEQCSMASIAAHWESTYHKQNDASEQNTAQHGDDTGYFLLVKAKHNFETVTLYVQRKS